MRYRLGRLLQMIGLVVPLIGVAGNIARPEEVPVKTTLTYAGIGMAIFYLGYLIQGKAPS